MRTPFFRRHRCHRENREASRVFSETSGYKKRSDQDRTGSRQQDEREAPDPSQGGGCYEERGAPRSRFSPDRSRQEQPFASSRNQPSRCRPDPRTPHHDRATKRSQDPKDASDIFQTTSCKRQFRPREPYRPYESDWQEQPCPIGTRRHLPESTCPEIPGLPQSTKGPRRAPDNRAQAQATPFLPLSGR